jgi:hypothetical protein
MVLSSTFWAQSKALEAAIVEAFFGVSEGRSLEDIADPLSAG